MYTCYIDNNFCSEKFRMQEYEEMLENESRKESEKGWNTTRCELASPGRLSTTQVSCHSRPNQSKTSQKTPKRKGIVAKGGHAINDSSPQLSSNISPGNGANVSTRASAVKSPLTRGASPGPS